MSDAIIVAKELQLAHSSTLGPVQFHGDSMRPFLRDGDELVVERVAWEAIQVGDILSYRLDDRFPTCRVVAKRGGKMVLKADNWPTKSFQVWPEDIIGRVVVRRRAGQLLHLADSRWTLATRLVLERGRLFARAARVRARAQRTMADARKRWIRARHGYAELPVAVQINVSRPCNLHCQMCPYLDLHADERRTRYMSLETFERLLPLAALVQRMHFSGSGEPTLNKDLTRFMRLVRERYPKKPIELTTNGTRLDERLARELIELRVYKLHVSIDGVNPETVQAIRRNVDFSKVKSNLERLRDLKRQMGSASPIVMANYMTGLGTYAEIVEFVRFAREMGIAEIQLLEMQPRVRSDVENNLLSNLERDGGRVLKDAVKLAESYGIQIHLPLTARNVCYFPYAPHIGEDGEVYACCFIDYNGRQLYSEGREVQMPGISFGNAARDGFKAVWESPAYVELRARNVRGDFPDYCRSCYLARIGTSEKVRELFQLN